MPSVKYISLIVLTFQNSALVLTMRYSRTADGPRYNPTTAVVLSESLKCLMSLVICFTLKHAPNKQESLDNGLPIWSSSNTQSSLADMIFGRKSGFSLLLIPAVLYTIQNNLQYVAATNLDAATFQITYQGKIIATAAFAVLILRQKLNGLRWLAIGLLTAGLAVISYPTGSSVIGHTPQGDKNVGFMAVSAACLTSGFAGVYTELVLKSAKDGNKGKGIMLLWIRNLQLGVASLIMSVIGAACVNGTAVLSNGFFHGYSPVVWATIFLQAVGGLVVAIVITYADNIAKSFATSISLIISTSVAVTAGDTVLTHLLVAGIALVLVATHIYGLAGSTEAGTEREVSGHDGAVDQETTAHQPLVGAEKVSVSNVDGENTSISSVAHHAHNQGGSKIVPEA